MARRRFFIRRVGNVVSTAVIIPSERIERTKAGPRVVTKTGVRGPVFRGFRVVGGRQRQAILRSARKARARR